MAASSQRSASAPTPARQRNAAASTARLLAAAASEFAEHGYEGARIDRISASSGLNRALLFQRFGDKAGLYRAVLSRVARDAAATRAAIIARRAAPSTRAEFEALVRELARATATFLGEHGEAARILAWERAAGWAAFEAVRPDVEDPAADRIVEWFRAAAESGWLRGEATPEHRLALVLELAAALPGEDPLLIEDVVAAALVAEEER